MIDMIALLTVVSFLIHVLACSVISRNLFRWQGGFFFLRENEFVPEIINTLFFPFTYSTNTVAFYPIIIPLFIKITFLKYITIQFSGLFQTFF